MHVHVSVSFCHSAIPHALFQSALGWEYQSELSKHESQTDAKKGFGGQFGVQSDRQDQVHVHVCGTP